VFVAGFNLALGQTLGKTTFLQKACNVSKYIICENHLSGIIFWGYRDEFLVSAGSGWTRRAGLSRRKITAEAWGGLADPRPVRTVVFNCVTNFVPQCHNVHYACSSIKTNLKISGTFSFVGNEGSFWDMRSRRPHGSATLRAAGS